MVPVPGAVIDATVVQFLAAVFMVIVEATVHVAVELLVVATEVAFSFDLVTVVARIAVGMAVVVVVRAAERLTTEAAVVSEVMGSSCSPKIFPRLECNELFRFNRSMLW